MPYLSGFAEYRLSKGTRNKGDYQGFAFHESFSEIWDPLSRSTWIEMMISGLARTPEYVFQDNIFDSEVPSHRSFGPAMRGIRSLIQGSAQAAGDGKQTWYLPGLSSFIHNYQFAS